MGEYLETGSVNNKLDDLVQKHGAVPISQPLRFDTRSDMALVVVLDNVMFQAAAWVYDQREFDDFAALNDGRKKSWLLMNQNKVHELTGRIPESRSR